MRTEKMGRMEKLQCGVNRQSRCNLPKIWELKIAQVEELRSIHPILDRHW